ncbi:M10 family metallopeptidase C-terminal domain-containing protein [Azospirillum sp. SYSU D00513]|uniref:M10 family metallopeptidase C-terminal domain-containing protein n=1 Tax=Azospirillum sp. SYSU D00513 TaxID=2812561 RepID=UPI001A9756D3|nr:M10 family metallopeptidase C-terminal domain-containing protein [Azospirillum sp. SYSU D00513]
MSVNSGAAYIDALVQGLDYRWNVGSPVGTPVALTYSFMSSAPSNADAEDRNGFQQLTEVQKAAVRTVLAEFARGSSLTFAETIDVAGVNLRFGANSQGTVSAAYAYLPHSTEAGNGGQVYLNADDPSMQAIAPGGYGFSTLLHETGHALGLKHPGNYNAGDDSATAGTPPFLSAAEDNTNNTVMSYTDLSSLQPMTLMRYDIAALQYLYGANSGTNAGNDIYSFPASAGLSTLWDTGGTDSLDFSNQTLGVRADLAPGGVSSVGALDNALASGNLSIAFGVIIENATGSAHADFVMGNTVANRITGGMGGDTLHGAGGGDLLAGNAGQDLLYGNADRDTLFGGADDDTLYGGQGDDALSGDNGSDRMMGDLGNDLLVGNAGADTLYGGRNEDTLYGGAGDDWLSGDLGNDWLSGDLGADTLAGGGGADLFVFRSGGNADLVADFSFADGDRLAAGGRTWTVADGAAGAVVNFGLGDTVTLAGIAARQVNQAWFAA